MLTYHLNPLSNPVKPMITFNSLPLKTLQR